MVVVVAFCLSSSNFPLLGSILTYKKMLLSFLPFFPLLLRGIPLALRRQARASRAWMAAASPSFTPPWPGRPSQHGLVFSQPCREPAVTASSLLHGVHVVLGAPSVTQPNPLTHFPLLPVHTPPTPNDRSRLLQGRLSHLCWMVQTTGKLKCQLSFTSEKAMHGISSINLGFCFTFQRYR